MTKAILSEAIITQIPELSGQVELCDEERRTLGYFLPPELHREYLYARATAQFADEEVEEARESMRKVSALPTAEAIAYLEGLAEFARDW